VRRADRAPKEIDLPTAGDDEEELSSSATRRGGGSVRTLAVLGTALATGALIAQFVPRFSQEKDVLGGVGIELQLAFEEWARRQVKTIAHRQADEPFRFANAIALGLGLLLATSGQSRKANATGSSSATP
jgi:hypothetical protein